MEEELDELGSENTSSLYNRKKKLVYIMPATVLIILTAVLVLYYNHSVQVNHSVLKEKEEAEKMALEGHYNEAEKRLAEAAEQRPDYQGLERSLSTVHDVQKMQEDLDSVESSIEENELDKALEQLAKVNKEMIDNENQLVVTLTPKLNQLDSRITVGKINNEVKELTKVDELADKLNTLSGLDLEEAARAREKITEKIVSISTKKAEDKINEKQYNEAIAAVDEGLQYVINHEKLLQLKERVEQEKQAFEQEKRERMEQAMEQQALEEMKNRREAVNVLDIEAYKDEFGDVTIDGEVQSEATSIISSIEVTYDILDKDDEVLETDTAQVYPMYLNPEDKGKFEQIYYDYEKEEDISVEVTNVQWFVE
ncbi:FxLYD domain-containing protein [Halobacillus sp. A5]|uniref:FxLYD domain-containing protein n=1 Tax=Halobacillus sp. A5 TaxID=2880263 RepID=UPI0020A6D8B8|nr:FxLYD domain-containing protein [Halobacillus sp. A5]MCP3026351.1 FxLYD domain-containing protein [Halobacillus sp. A5]